MYLPPAERDSKENVKSIERLLLPPVGNNINSGYLPPEKSHYIYNKPKVIDDPLPKKIDYEQPISLDFLTGQYKPTFEGGLISGLFVNDNQIQKLNFENSKELKRDKNIKTILIKSNPYKLYTKVHYILKPIKYEIKAESSNQNNKYVKIVDDSDEIIPINHYEDKAMIYILFNYNDNTELSASAPVVIYKPGDDLTFTEDITVIDNYEHMFPMEILSDNYKTTTSPKTIITNRITSTTTTTTTPVPPQETRSSKDSLTKEEKRNHSSSKENKSDYSKYRTSSEEKQTSSDGNKSDHYKNRSSSEENKSDPLKTPSSSEVNKNYPLKNRSSSEDKLSKYQISSEKETVSDHSKQRSASEETESDHFKQRSSSEESNNSKTQSSSEEAKSDHSKYQISSKEKNENDQPDHQYSKHGGYIYEKPKIPFTF
ncbi:uncharacterized protein ACRADG_002137 [Cochliomyia hominivorax]